MVNNMNQVGEAIALQLSHVKGSDITFKQMSPVGGGCINQGWIAVDQYNKRWFIKTNRAALSDMFHAEFEGLNALSLSRLMTVPKPVLWGVAENCAFLVMEYMDLTGRLDSAQFGYALAELHQHVSPEYGWYRGNTIGETPQSNRQHKDWVTFWREERLLPQLEGGRRKGLSRMDYDNGLKLVDQLSDFFSGYTPQASLLHGDLWSGNCAANCDGNPVVFDPAVYYGDKEADLAMTELFGGFGERFYAAYHEISPIDSGYPVRKVLYNLYHILNHYQLFGGGYGTQSAAMIQRLLSETH